MDIKTRIRRSLARATCDKTELDRTVLRFKKCFDEASAALCGKGKKQKNKDHKGEMHMEKMFTAADFDTEVLGSDKPVLVDFFATWCGPCKMMAPAVEKLAEEYEGRAVIGKLDVEESMDIAGRYGVMNVPTLILFKDGRAVERKVGLQSASDLRKLLDSVL